ncbi:MAG: sensor histidine kinase [Kiritimatiellae bacterium]|nr:sensor histidine kinase [Kiritimatiellia bacterium]MBQ8126739.1 sensor histidine kinase [Kiritimatiellia bacterium]
MAKDKTRLLHTPCLRMLAFIAGVALATGLKAAPLTTAAELAATNRGEDTGATDFAITATLVRVLAPETTDSLCVTDDSGYTTLRLPFNLRPKGLVAGCSLRLSGTIDFDAPSSPQIVATNCIVLAEGPAPKARDVSIRDVHSGKFDFQLVHVTADVHDAFRDEIDKGTTFLVLMQNGQTLYAAMPNEYLSKEEFTHLIGATVSITGICDAYCGTARRYRGRTVNPTAKEDIVVVEPSAKDIFAEPDIAELKLASPDQLHAFGRHTVKGRVVAVWDSSSILVKRANGEFTTILSAQDGLPGVGETIVACGFPETDLYTITLTRAAWKKISDTDGASEAPAPIAAGNLIAKSGDCDIFMPLYHGQAVRLDGLVRTLPGFGNETRLQLDCDGTVFPVDVSANPSATDGLEIGCRAAFTGICVMNIERLRPNTAFPHISGFTLVMRPNDAIEIISRPSWWTPERAWTAFGGFSALLLAALAWIVTLQRVAERRGRALLKGELETAKSKLQVEERTRLAVELHDSLSQTLTGVSLEIAAADDLKGDAPADMVMHLSRAGRVLKSCRDELKNCLWDLRSTALDEPDMTSAVLLTLRPVVNDGTRVSVRFNVPRARLSDNTAHAILRIIRELVVNAMRHGGATGIQIAGSLDREALRFSVTDNGCGFDPDDHPGVLQGHFGLQGVEERLGQIGGSMTIESETGKGARIACSIAVPPTPTTEGV